MPRITARAATLAVLQSTQDALAVSLARQVLMNEMMAMDEEEMGVNDEDEEMLEEEQAFRDLFQDMGFGMLDDLQKLQEKIERSRCLEGTRIWRGLKKTRRGTLEWYFSMNQNWFRTQFRVDHSGFLRVLNCIQDDDVFRNNSRNPQEPVEYQLMVALARFGHYGNGVTVMSVARDFRVAEGTAMIWTRRVTAALLAVQEQWVRWPTPSEREQIKTRIGTASAFPHCVGFVDGSLLPMDIKPAYIGASDWYSYKRIYGVNCMFVCDDENRITYMSLGWGGAAHDARVYRNSALKREAERFFSPGEFILGDSAYKPSQTVIPAYKENVAHPTAPIADRKRFNKELSRMRVTIEHTFGMLKSRFQSLRGLRQMVTGKRTFQLLLAHVRACAVLHNILVGVPDDSFWDDYDMGEMRRKWEEEAREIRDLIGREGEAEGPGIFTDEPLEDMREALRFWFQTNGYQRPYGQNDGLDF